MYTTFYCHSARGETRNRKFIYFSIDLLSSRTLPIAPVDSNLSESFRMSTSLVKVLQALDDLRKGREPFLHLLINDFRG